MSKRVYIPLLAALAMMLNSVCFCIAVVPGCTDPSCETQQRKSDCPDHPQHRHSRGDHACCKVSACSSFAQIRGESSDHQSHLASIAPIARLDALGFDWISARSSIGAKEHSPQSAVPVFLFTRSLLI